MSTSDPLDFLDTVDLTEPAARPPRRKPKLWDRLAIYLPVMLMGLLALASYWLLRATPAPEAPQAARPVSGEPDYFMRVFSVKAFEPDGSLKSEVFGDEARHHPDDDRVEIDRARMRNLSPEGVVSTASANRVITNADNTRFLLQGDAVIVRQGGTDADGAPLPRLATTEKVICIGASTGGTEAIREVLVQMPADRPKAVSLASASACSKLSAGTMQATGPKISSRAMRMPGSASTNNAGSK